MITSSRGIGNRKQILGHRRTYLGRCTIKSVKYDDELERKKGNFIANVANRRQRIT